MGRLVLAYGWLLGTLVRGSLGSRVWLVFEYLGTDVARYYPSAFGSVGPVGVGNPLFLRVVCASCDVNRSSDAGRGGDWSAQVLREQV